MSIWTGKHNNHPRKTQFTGSICVSEIVGRAPNIVSGWIQPLKPRVRGRTREHSFELTLKPIETGANEKPRPCLCIRCRERRANTKHHIIPRIYGGEEYKENMIDLCSRCHDEVEIKTEDWINSGGRIDINLLRSLIANNGF